MALDEHMRYIERHMVEPFRICGELYYIGDDDVCSYLINTSEGLIIIDTGYPTGQGALIHSIYSLGFDPRDIRLILHSHGHFDHFGATRLLQAISGAKTAIGRKDAEMFLERPELALREPHLPCSHVELFEVDRPLEEGDVIELGGTSIAVEETPGHTEGTVSYFFDVHEDGKAYRVGLLGGAGMNTMHREFYEKYHVGGYHKLFLATLKRMDEKKADIALGTHTGQFSFIANREAYLNGAAHNSFIAPSQWNTYIKHLINRIQVQIANEQLEM